MPVAENIFPVLSSKGTVYLFTFGLRCTTTSTLASILPFKKNRESILIKNNKNIFNIVNIKNRHLLVPSKVPKYFLLYL